MRLAVANGAPLLGGWAPRPAAVGFICAARGRRVSEAQRRRARGLACSGDASRRCACFMAAHPGCARAYGAERESRRRWRRGKARELWAGPRGAARRVLTTRSC